MSRSAFPSFFFCYPTLIDDEIANGGETVRLDDATASLACVTTRPSDISTSLVDVTAIPNRAINNCA